MHLFYAPDVAADNVYTLPEAESKHCIRILRLEKGDSVILVDGKGGFYRAEIVYPHLKNTILNILERQLEYQKRNYYLHLALAPTKNLDRVEWCLEKATEIGVDEISLIICDRSERKTLKLDRLNKIITAAVKQSIKAYHPKLNEPVLYKNFLLGRFESAQKFIAYCGGDERKTLTELITKQANYTILIGPEGDFTSEEIDLALTYNFMPLSLGASRFRTETAVLAACFEINFLNR